MLTSGKAMPISKVGMNMISAAPAYLATTKNCQLRRPSTRFPIRLFNWLNSHIDRMANTPMSISMMTSRFNWCFHLSMNRPKMKLPNARPNKKVVSIIVKA